VGDPGAGGYAAGFNESDDLAKRCGCGIATGEDSELPPMEIGIVKGHVTLDEPAENQPAV